MKKDCKGIIMILITGISLLTLFVSLSCEPDPDPKGTSMPPDNPTTTPTLEITEAPTGEPAPELTPDPTPQLTETPSEEPTPDPTIVPTTEPTEEPTPSPVPETPEPTTPMSEGTPSPLLYTMTMGFEDSDDWTDWVFLNIDEGYNSTVSIETNWLTYTDPAVAHSGEVCLVSIWNDNSLPNDDWIITPVIQPSSTSLFRFWAAPLDYVNSEESFEIFYFDGSSFNILGIYQFAAGDTSWREFTFDLYSYVNQYINIAIRCTSVDQFMLRVDDITISQLIDNNEVKRNFKKVPVNIMELENKPITKK